MKQFGYYNPNSFASDSNLNNAIEDFQHFHHLKVTGVVDEETKTEMKKPRCGLPDKPSSGNGNAYFKTWHRKWPNTDLTYAFLNTGKYTKLKFTNTMEKLYQL